jgi:predicted Zn-dependent peptidase
MTQKKTTNSARVKPVTSTVKGTLRSFQTYDDAVSQFTLPNGLQIIHTPLPTGDLRLHIALVINVGSRMQSAAQAGLAHLVEHMMFRGSEKFPTFGGLSEAFEDIGGEWNAATGHEYTEFFYSGTCDRLHEALELLSDFIFRPKLNDLETEKRIVLRELEGELNEQGFSTDTDYHVLRTVWPESTMAHPIVGYEDSIKRVTLADIKDYIHRYYRPKNMVLSVCGGRAKDLKLAVPEYFAKASRATPAKKCPDTPLTGLSRTTSNHFVFVENSDNEYDIQVSFLCEGTAHGDTVTYDMLARILADGFSSRMVKRIREELGLVYDISAAFHQYQGAGLFSISANIAAQHIEVFFNELYTIIRQVVSVGVTDRELERHRRRALTDLQILLSDPSGLSFRNAWNYLTEQNLSLQFWYDQIEGVTLSQIQSVARELFRPEKYCVGVLGPDESGVVARLKQAGRFTLD